MAENKFTTMKSWNESELELREVLEYINVPVE